jgi:hypothetical protein
MTDDHVNDLSQAKQQQKPQHPTIDDVTVKTIII